MATTPDHFRALLFRERQSERNRIARILHDHFLQHCQLLVGALQEVLDKDYLGSSDRAALDALVRDAQEVMLEGRELILELRQATFAAPLDERVQQLGRFLCQRAGIAFSCQLGHTLGSRSDAMADELYMLLAEAIRNAVRHARASRIDIRCAGDDGDLTVSVADDGAGIPARVLAGADSGQHYGLAGMRERAAALHAVLHIDTAPGAGTTVSVRFARGGRVKE